MGQKPKQCSHEETKAGGVYEKETVDNYIKRREGMAIGAHKLTP